MFDTPASFTVWPVIHYAHAFISWNVCVGVPKRKELWDVTNGIAVYQAMVCYCKDIAYLGFYLEWMTSHVLSRRRVAEDQGDCNLIFPSSQGITYSSESHPERDGPSVQFGAPLAVPRELFPPNQSLANGYTIAIFFRPRTLNDG